MACRLSRCCAGNEAVSQVQILPQLVRVARFAGIIAGGHNAAAQASVRIFKAADIIPLPAVQADRQGFQDAQRLLSINAQCGVSLAGQGIGSPNLFV